MIRKISVLDADYMASAVQKGFSDGWNKKMILSAFETGNFFGYVYVKNSNPIAFITYTAGIDGADIEDVFTEEGERNCGIASALIESVIEDIKKQGLKKIFLEVKEDNVGAIRLYKKFGFIKIAERKKYYSDGKTAFVLIKDIKDI